MKTVYLVDVSSLFFRSYYAISPHLTSPHGVPTNALYGLLSMTVKFLREYSAEYVVYCLDHEKPSFRKKIYKEYKANRGEMPEDLKQQLPYIKKLVQILGIPTMIKESYEADDLIGSLSVQACAKKFEVVIVSGDKDFAQLVGPCVSMYDPMREKTYDIEGVKNKWGVYPQQMVDYLALVGDSSDNIPGVTGIGPKGASNLLEKYKSLEGIYKCLDDLPKKTMDKLRKGKDLAFLSQKLVRIVTDGDWGVTDGRLKLQGRVADCSSDELTSFFRRQDVNRDQLEALLKELGFTLKPEYFVLSPKNNKKNTNKTNHPIRSGNSSVVSKVVSKNASKDRKLPGNLKTHFITLSDLCVLITPYAKVWVFSHNDQIFLSYKNRVISLVGLSLDKVGKVLFDKNVCWHGYDLKSLWRKFLPDDLVVKPLGMRIGRAGWCTMMAGYLTQGAASYGFRQLCLKYLDEEVSKDLLPGEVYRLHTKLQKALENDLAQKNMMDLYQNIELPLIAVLLEMECWGIQLNVLELQRQSVEIQEDLSVLKKKIFNYTKNPFNLASPQQLADVLFKQLNLSPVRKIKTGYSTSADVLEKLKDKHLIVPLILEYRELFKLETTYVSALPKMVNKKTSCVHTHFRQALTTTGRLSSVHPNLQNIPVKTKRGKQIRRAFTARKDCVLVSADYSQIELRVLAHLTEDVALCQAFESDQDIHRVTASKVYGVPLGRVSDEQRYSAKAVNFGLIYGQGAYSLSELLEVSLESAKDLIQSYFQKFKRVREYMESSPQKARQRGYVETVFGRRRYIGELQSVRFHTQKFGERAAINMPVQGTAGDLVKIAMLELRNSLYSPILLQIHDELLFECNKNLVDEEVKYIKNIMENVVSWRIPLKVNIRIGKNWEEMSPFSAC